MIPELSESFRMLRRLYTYVKQDILLMCRAASLRTSSVGRSMFTTLCLVCAMAESF